MTDTRIIECDACQGSGRHLVYHQPAPWEIGPCNERDVGRCGQCSGSGEVEVEMQPVEMDDNSED